jgi:hypothetical protein
MKHILIMFYIYRMVNSSKFLYDEATNSNAVTTERFNKRKSNTMQPNISVKAFVARYLSMYQVTEVKDPKYTKGFYLKCDCPGYCNTASYCSHTVAVYHLLGEYGFSYYYHYYYHYYCMHMFVCGLFDVCLYSCTYIKLCNNLDICPYIYRCNRCYVLGWFPNADKEEGQTLQ